MLQITIREPDSALTHLAGFVLALFAAVPLLIKSGIYGGSLVYGAMLVFILSMILLYGASTLYHSVNVRDKALAVFRKIDHMMIFMLIAGSYTPVCILVLGGRSGLTLLAVVWGLALTGMLVNAVWINCPKWVSSVIYIALGWSCVAVFRSLFLMLPTEGFLWLLMGGIVYTAGGIIYALKLPLFNRKSIHFSSHALFHLFVLGGSICHFVFMYRYVI